MAYITKKTTVNGVKPIGSNLYGTCSTAGGTAQKDVVMADFDVLVSGVTIHVYFANKNTASNPTLKVGSTSAIAISCNGASEGNWEDGAVISFTYNGSNWIQNDASESGATYTLSKSGDTITLTGSDGSTSSVTDSDTILKYTADAPDGATTNNVVQNDVENNVASGGYSLAEGIGTTASGLYSHAEGQGTTASGDRSHAEGNGSTASGHSSRAEGNGTVASGNHSHAEGNVSVASGSGSHAEGSHTEASSDHSHAEGFYTVASGNRSFAGNNRTIAQRADQTVIGRMNIADTQGADGGELGKYAFIIGNGNADDDRSNALTVDWNGNVDIASGGEYRVGGKSITSQPIKVVQYGWVASPALSERTRVIPGANPANSSNSSDEPSSSEYTFVAWILFASNGWVGALYPSAPTSRTTDIWTATVKAATTGVSIYGTALYVRNDLL